MTMNQEQNIGTEDRNIYYVDIKSGDISQEEPKQGGHFRIFANDKEMEELIGVTKKMYSKELNTYARSHVPFVDYDTAEQNDQYDRQLIALYEVLYRFGDTETKDHIEGMNILGKERLNEQEDF